MSSGGRNEVGVVVGDGAELVRSLFRVWVVALSTDDVTAPVDMQCVHFAHDSCRPRVDGTQGLARLLSCHLRTSCTGGIGPSAWARKGK